VLSVLNFVLEPSFCILIQAFGSINLPKPVYQPQQKIATAKNFTVLLAVGKLCILEPVAFEEYLEVLEYCRFNTSGIVCHDTGIFRDFK
jgi:hypothetical protein